MWLLSVLEGTNLIFQGPWFPVGPGRCPIPCFSSHTVLGTGGPQLASKGRVDVVGTLSPFLHFCLQL
jgi:hypothetical protein